MKKIVIVLACLIAAAAPTFALKSTPDFAMGVEVTTINFSTIGAMLTLHIPGIALYIGAGADFYNTQSGDVVDLAATIDYWLIHLNAKYLNFYLGLGLYGAMNLDATWYAAGLRLPIGLQVWPLNNEKLELFLEVAPAWVPLITGTFEPISFQAQCALGLRFWFERGR